MGDNLATFGTAESECLMSWPDWPHPGRLFFSQSRQVVQRVTQLVKDSDLPKKDVFWLGVDDR